MPIAKLLIILPHFKPQPLCHTADYLWSHIYMAILTANWNKADQGSPEDVLHMHNKTFRSTVWLGNLGCDGSLTCEDDLCPFERPSLLLKHGISWCSVGLYPAQAVSPGSRVCWEAQLQKAKRQAMPRGRQDRDSWWQKEPLTPRAPSSHSTVTSTNHHQQHLPGKGQDLAPIIWRCTLGLSSSEKSYLTQTANPPKAVFLYLWCLQSVHQHGLCEFTPWKITD